MKRRLITCSVLAFALSLPATASAGSLRGAIAAVGQGTFTVQTPGRPVGVVNALSAAASRVNNLDYPYVYGGGHAQAGIASVGMKGPGYNGRRIGYDCSGSVAAVLTAGGLWPSGAGVPSDAGIIFELLARRLIARGAGVGPVEVTLYDDPGVHIFMNIDGRFFGTSDGGGGGNRRGGAGWLDDGAPDTTSRRYRRYHVLPAALKQTTNAGHTTTFQAGALQESLGALEVGEKVDITYEQTRAGTLVAQAIGYPGASTTTGVVSSIPTDGSSLTVTTADGTNLTLAAAGDLARTVAGLVVGDSVQMTYTKSGAGLTLLSVTVTVTPPAGPQASGPSNPGATGSPNGSGN